MFSNAIHKGMRIKKSRYILRCNGLFLFICKLLKNDPSSFLFEFSFVLDNSIRPNQSA